MAITAAVVLRFTGLFLATLTMGVAAIWGAFALWFQAPGGNAVRALTVSVWVCFNLILIVYLWHGRAAVGMLMFALAFAAMLIWWRGIAPSNDRIWADDVARMATGTVDGNRVTLHNVRNFDWRSNIDYTQRWESRSYDLDRLKSADIIMSYWQGPAIAHMLISFGFDDDEYIVFSVEIRREKTESFSEIGGFFKKFELSVIAADERDVIRLRTNVRREEDYLYRLQMPLTAIRSLFLAYVDETNVLARTPRFYNTISVNCTTLVYHMMTRIVGYLPLSYRLLLSGYLPEYVYDVGGLDRHYSFQELRTLGRITERARKADDSATFSADIRQGVPGIR